MQEALFQLDSTLHRTAGQPDRYTLRLTNRSPAAIENFRLGFSGPARLAQGATLDGGRIVEQLATWCVVEPEPALALGPGESWAVSVADFAFPLQHWSDGATGAALLFPDGTTADVAVSPCRLADDATPRRRGVMPVHGEPGPQPYSIVPWPNEVVLSGWQPAPLGLSLLPADAAGSEAARTFRRLATALFGGSGLVRPQAEGGFPVELEPAFDLQGEAYRISFETTRAIVWAETATGFLYGLITLGQMLRGARLQPQRYGFPTEGIITDAPALRWRGTHLDVARQFYGSGEIAQFLRILAWNKLNRFHWHLSDDEAWRVEIRAMPQLTDHGANRGIGEPIPPLLGSPGRRSGGFYNQDTVRELVTLAATLGIEIVPEIDMPGHCYALLTALPELRDPGETGPYFSIQGFPNNCLNPAVEAVYPALDTILGELCALFPSRYFHLGADEVPADAWSGSPLAQSLLAQLGGTGAAQLQAHFLRRSAEMLHSAGKIVGAWEEAAQGGGLVTDGSYLVGWHTVAASRTLAAQGYDVVVSPGQAYYLDMANGPEWPEPGAHWAGWSSPEATYTFDPVKGWTESERQRLLGVQACIWSESMTDRGVFERLVFPRLSAIAETGWTIADNKSWPRFAAASSLMPSLYGIAPEEF